MYRHRWHGGAGCVFALLIAVVTQTLTAVFVAAAASRVAVDRPLLTRLGYGCCGFAGRCWYTAITGTVVPEALLRGSRHGGAGGFGFR